MSVFRPIPHPGALPHNDLPDILLTWFIQVTGLAAALIFGIFSILSWSDAQHAKEQAKAANLLAVAAICAQVGENPTNEAMQAICGPFFRDAWPNLSAAVETLLPYTPTRTASTTTSTSTITSMSSSSSTDRTLPVPGNATSDYSSSSPMAGGVTSETLSSTTMRVSATPSSAPDYSSSSGGGGGSPSGRDIGLGVGLGVGLVTVIVSALTVWKMRRRSGKMMYAPVQGSGGAPD